MEVDSERMRMRLMPSPVQCLNAIKVGVDAGSEYGQRSTMAIGANEKTSHHPAPRRFCAVHAFTTSIVRLVVNYTCLLCNQELLPELMEAGSGALLDELDAIIPHISGGSASVEDFVAKKKAVAAAHQDNPRHIEASCAVFPPLLVRFVLRRHCWRKYLPTLSKLWLRRAMRWYVSVSRLNQVLRHCFRLPATWSLAPRAPAVLLRLVAFSGLALCPLSSGIYVDDALRQP